MSKYKCKGCQWYNKPYWSIINPRDNCPRENTNVEIITRWQDPTIEELKTQLQQKENVINELDKHLEEELDRLARETSNIYEDGLGKTRLVNENIYEEVQKIKNKLQELKGSDKE